MTTEHDPELPLVKEQVTDEVPEAPVALPLELRTPAPEPSAESAEPPPLEQPPEGVPPLEEAPTPPDAFAGLGLAPALLKAIAATGYSTPTPIQARTIPLLLEGRDILGQAQTGTGKTAAFALPILQGIDLCMARPQVLVLTPTRELALQVAEAFQRYGAHLEGLSILPIYGGQAYPPQLRALSRGVHVIVGTPGRIMDHLQRGSLSLSALKTCVLDEADEMLRMGFFEDVTWILDQTPTTRQVALFSATLPKEVQHIAKRYLNQPERVTVKVEDREAQKIRQRVWIVRGTHKLDALTRILEVEKYDGVLIFVRTRSQTVELSEKLGLRGIAAAPLSGDIPQHLRERTVDKLKRGQLDVVVATDVAARGLDVERISHVINFDAPMDAESYVHRIGRTGRAGRQGEAILFLAPRERRMLQWLERSSRSAIHPMQLPSTAEVNAMRTQRFGERIRETLANHRGVAEFRTVLEELAQSDDTEPLDPMDIAAALACMHQGEEPFFLSDKATWKDKRARTEGPAGTERPAHSPRPEKRDRVTPTFVPFPEDVEAARAAAQRLPRAPAPANELFRIEVGYRDQLKPAHVVATISNQAELDGRLIGNIDIREAFAYVELPRGMPAATFEALRSAEIMHRPLELTRYEGETSAPRPQGNFRPHAKSRPQGKFGSHKKPGFHSKPGFHTKPGAGPHRKKGNKQQKRGW